MRRIRRSRRSCRLRCSRKLNFVFRQWDLTRSRLFAKIAAAMGDLDLANEVLQETNLVMWRKSDEFEIGSNFNAWSYRIANFQIMSHRQRRLREKLLFDQELVEKITQRAQDRSESYALRMRQLDRCIGKMP